MRIHYCSDLHLEFGPLNQPMPEGEILILGGDITLLQVFDHESHGYYAARGTLLRERTLAFIEQCRESFGRIFYLIGNHEAYGYDLSKASKTIRSKLKGVELLENKAVDLGSNVILAGATLWTDMNKGNDAWIVSRSMNDFLGAIHIEDREGTRTPGVYEARRFTTNDAIAMFNKSQRFIARTADANKGKTIVVATHHGPSPLGVGTEHADSRIWAGWFTVLHDFIEAHPNIRYWTHGHSHFQGVYDVYQCQVHSNARGYIGRERSADRFSPDAWFDPVTGERSRYPLSKDEVAQLVKEEIEARALEPLDNDF